MLELPSDAPREGADSTVYSLRRGSDPGGLSSVAAEVGLHRQFTRASRARTGSRRARCRCRRRPGQAAVRADGRAGPDRGERRLHGAPRHRPQRAQSHRRGPDHGVDRGRTPRPASVVAGEEGGRGDRLRRGGRALHPSRTGADQLAGRDGGGRSGRERDGPLLPDQDRPAGHHHLAAGSADGPQPGGRRPVAAAGRAERDPHPGAGAVPHAAAEARHGLRAALRQGPGAVGRRHVPGDPGRGPGTGSDAAPSDRGDALHEGRHGGTGRHVHHRRGRGRGPARDHRRHAGHRRLRVRGRGHAPAGGVGAGRRRPAHRLRRRGRGVLSADPREPQRGLEGHAGREGA